MFNEALLHPLHALYNCNSVKHTATILEILPEMLSLSFSCWSRMWQQRWQTWDQRIGWDPVNEPL